MSIFDKLSLAGLVPVIKVEDAQDAVPLCKALLDGGLPVAEITFRTAAAEQAIKNVHEALPGVMLGAGTVLTIEQVKRAVAAGAAYIVSPGFNPEVVGYCVDAGIPILPGCSGPSDIERALAVGIHTVKFFPAEALGGLKLIKAMSAPYGQVTFVPTGGVNEKNAPDYLAFPKVKAIGGSWMVPDDAVRAKDWARITLLTKSAVELVLGLRLTRVVVDGEEAEGEKLTRLLGRGASAIGLTQPGERRHLEIGCNSLPRAIWHLTQRGFLFGEPAGPKEAWLSEAIAGFGIKLVQQ